MQERLQKLLAQAGYGSRRACEEFLISGRVRVNGLIAILGQKADLTVDKVTIDGKALPKAESLTYIALYKPRNVLSAAEGQDDRETVRGLIPVEGHLYPVGRLDYDSEGLILMTNDGELTNKLTHPRFGHEKEYRVLVASRPDEKQFEAWRRGVVLDDGDKTMPADVVFISSSGKGAWIRVVMGEGKKRQIREVGRLLGLPVVKIVRMRIGTLKLGSLKPRQWRYLTESEVMELKGEKRKLVEKSSERGRANQLQSKDRPKRESINTSKARSKLGPNERPRTKERTQGVRDDRLDSSTKSRKPRR
ncbi:MAG: pseudouridine synthase [Chloroflexi bacterium]|nr:pseudouridine synthase [Chloroflexota bacterium]